MSLNIADPRGSRLGLQDLDYVKDLKRSTILSVSTASLSFHKPHKNSLLSFKTCMTFFCRTIEASTGKQEEQK